MKNFRRKPTVVSFGWLNVDAPQEEDVYNIIIVKIFDVNENLYDSDETLGDIMIASTINLPKFLVQFNKV